MSLVNGLRASTAARPGGKRAALLHRTSIGTLALTASSAIRLGLQFAMLPILARLIGPAEYGLVALAMPFILLANVLSDGGVGFALGHRRDVTRNVEATAFWLSASLGLGLALLCSAAAFPIGLAMDQPRLPALIIALSPILLLNALAAPANARVIREGRFSVFAGGDLIATLISAAVALAAAVNGFGAWSLVAQQLTLWFCKFAWVSVSARPHLGFIFDLAEAWRILRFGMHVVGATLADFMSRTLDNLIVGAVLGTTSLGFYAMAYQIVRVPDLLISGPLRLYIFTALSNAAHHSPTEVKRLVVAGLRLGSAVVAPLLVGLALVADLAVPLVLGEQWEGAIGAMQRLALAGFFFCMCGVISVILMGLGRAALQFRMSLVLAGVTVAIVAGTAPFGLEAVTAGLVGGSGLVLGSYLHRLGKGLEISRRALAVAFGPTLVGVIAMTAAVAGTRGAVGHAPPLGEFALTVAVGGSVYPAVLLTLARRRLLDDLHAFVAAQAKSDVPQAHGLDPAVAAQT